MEPFDDIEGALNNPLTKASEEDLIAELSRRSQTTIFLRCKTKNDGQDLFLFRYNGNLWTCIGMAQQFLHNCLHFYSKGN